MAKFIFKFEALLNHRRLVEDQRQRELAQHLRGQMILQEQLRAMQQTIRQSKRQLGAGLIGRVDLAAISQFAGFSGHTAMRARQIVARLAEIDKQVHAARQSLLDAARQRKALELLRDRQHDAWRRERQRREDAELDDLANLRYAHTLMAGGVR